jgi:cell wall-associated NlpC family hydrolase
MPHSAAGLAALAVAGMTLAGCASTGAVPRPFPGAPARAERPPATTAAAPAVGGITEDVPLTVAELPLELAPAPPVGPTPATTIGALALAMAMDFRGVRYRNGGSDPSGFDCSGLVQFVFARQGIALPRETQQQFGSGYEIPSHEIRPGDLVFFNTDARGPSHVGIVVDRASFVHAPNSRGVVRVEQMSTSYWAKRFLGARRIE